MILIHKNATQILHRRDMFKLWANSSSFTHLTGDDGGGGGDDNNSNNITYYY
jgi:hypothetical protein